MDCTEIWHCDKKDDTLWVNRIKSILSQCSPCLFSCLGLKSPFIEFRSEYETLSNISISMNLTIDESNGVTLNRNMGSNPSPSTNAIDNLQISAQNTALLSKQRLLTRVEVITPSPPTSTPSTSQLLGTIERASTIKTEYITSASISNVYDREIRIIEEIPPGRDLAAGGDQQMMSVNDRKYIIPMALRQQHNTKEPRKSSIFRDSATTTNIDDLKRHIVMLHNLTKHDRNFKSKFVQFPSLRRHNANDTSTNATTERSRDQLRNRTPTAKPADEINPLPKTQDILRDTDEERVDDGDLETILNHEKVTIVPQVLLQNDQTPITATIENSSNTHVRINHENLIMTTTKQPRKSNEDVKRGKKAGNKKRKKKQPNKVCKETDDKVIGNCTLATAWRNRKGRKMANRNQPNTTRDVVELEDEDFDGENATKKLQRVPRNQRSHSIENQPINPPNIYIETVDVNPSLCHQVGGLSYGQQKLCVLHTNIMPAISRGARSAIQECKHQFKNRRWNCSTVDDDTVFGPITSIGSPEMAFIHALAAAGVASFIARACRDGQLASCGCSRSSRPKQLHRDWTWGGCGDDLEFGYKFSQTFIDIREKEKKRGPRGLMTLPQRINKIEEKISPEIANDTEHQPQPLFKPEDIKELQEKIKKEIEDSKLQEKEMHELQEKINREIFNSKIFNLENRAMFVNNRRQKGALSRIKLSGTALKARSLMNLHNNEVGRRAVIKKSRITCKCHGVSGSCSLITCWQQLSSMREIGNYLREKYDEATRVKMNKRGRLQVHDSRFKVPTALDLVYLDESPDWCRNSKQLQWQGTHGRVCNKTSSGLDSCSILCCGRGYNTKKIVVRERCNCKFQWCCHVKCDVCVKVIEEFTCK
ncbi:protein Wnt-5 [Phlebotomus argentipes]|uniref:protein Wnt-5 n=1 Tax=Phlebotomus argentipes TaxID=94469 RepID=UPI0028935DD6|nr:protein Wnt-5 [Phlebotomus argentipes]